MGEIVDALRRANERSKQKQNEREAEGSEHDSSADQPAFDAPAPPSQTRSAPPPTNRAPLDLLPNDEPGVEPSAISREESGDWAARTLLIRRSGPAAEGYRKFALRVRALLQKSGKKSLAVTGPLREEGKTTTACNLAFGLASIAGDDRIALLDLDLRRPSIAETLGVEPRAGIEEVLRGKYQLADCVVPTEIPHLDLYLVKKNAPDAEELLAKRSFALLLEELSRSYSIIIIDTPPVILVPDTPLIAVHADAYIVVSRAGRTRVRSVNEMMEVLPKGKLLGAFLNEVASRTQTFGYDYGYYGEEEDEPEKTKRSTQKRGQS